MTPQPSNLVPGARTPAQVEAAWAAQRAADLRRIHRLAADAYDDRREETRRPRT